MFVLQNLTIAVILYVKSFSKCCFTLRSAENLSLNKNWIVFCCTSAEKSKILTPWSVKLTPKRIKMRKLKNFHENVFFLYISKYVWLATENIQLPIIVDLLSVQKSTLVLLFLDITFTKCPNLTKCPKMSKKWKVDLLWMRKHSYTIFLWV